MDVTPLYKDIPHKDGIQASSDFLDRQTNPTNKTTRFCDLIRLTLTNNTLTFNGQLYREILSPKVGESKGAN